MGHPFFDGNNASEILKLNRKFTTEFESIGKVKEEFKNPNSKINKDGIFNYAWKISINVYIAISLLTQLLEFDHKKRLPAGLALQHLWFQPIPQGIAIASEPLTKTTEFEYL